MEDKVKRLIKTVTLDLHKSMFRKTYLFQCLLIACARHAAISVRPHDPVLGVQLYIRTGF